MISQKEFILACAKGDIDKVEAALENDSKLLHCKNGGPLIAACSYNRLEIVIFLVEKGIDYRKDNDMALVEACKWSDIEIVMFLISNGCDVNAQNGLPLINACTAGNLRLVQYLVKIGADFTMSNYAAFISACKYNKLQIAEFLIKKGLDFDRVAESCVLACAASNVRVVKWLYNKKADLNIVLDLPFLIAYERQKEDNMKFLILNTSVDKKIVSRYVSSEVDMKDPLSIHNYAINCGYNLNGYEEHRDGIKNILKNNMLFLDDYFINEIMKYYNI
jgi:ankyrin repeat protein